ncbi:putative CCR4-associated factor 1 like 11 [Apostasia shenzhenica]|uniref:Putative CCR4-associated factor 1 like 11 n=1 Tax=Apostasia shenzhenica TaxID=1088818 RepID=A0A2I0AG87_9ASPA|nr:putative CCR4-associated factor 1 like 11 [Apostasia shenzhenica]
MESTAESKHQLQVRREPLIRNQIVRGLILIAGSHLFIPSMEVDLLHPEENLAGQQAVGAALSPAERYALIRANVDDLRPIQADLTLADTCTGGAECFTWEFDLCDFDPRRHPHAPESIALLESSGMDFDRLRREGVPSTWLARLLCVVGLVGSGVSATWVAFQGGYDFGFLIKMVMRMTTPWGRRRVCWRRLGISLV